MLNLKRLIALTTFGLLVLPSNAMANTPDVRATTILAINCAETPLGPIATAENRLRVSGPAYAFRSSSTGVANLNCHLPINNRTVFNNLNNNSISAYRVYYQDPDGAGTAAEIRTELRYITTNGNVVTVCPASSSNTSNATLFTSRVVPCNHQFGANRLYYFQVTMSRSNINQTPFLVGIDFP